MPVIWQCLTKEIEANRKFHVRRIKIHYIFDPILWYVIENFCSQVPVGINDSYSIAGSDVLENHVAQEGCLSGSALSNGVQVVPAVVRSQIKGALLPPIIPNP